MGSYCVHRTLVIVACSNLSDRFCVTRASEDSRWQQTQTCDVSFCLFLNYTSSLLKKPLAWELLQWVRWAVNWRYLILKQTSGHLDINSLLVEAKQRGLLWMQHWHCSKHGANGYYWRQLHTHACTTAKQLCVHTQSHPLILFLQLMLSGDLPLTT